MRFILGVDDVENFLWYSRRIDTLEHDIVSLWLVNVHNIHYFVVVCNLEGEYLFTQLAIHFLELDNDLPLVYLHGPLRLEPTF